jgi:predicted membrane chloride channel (bestrophin family)
MKLLKRILLIINLKTLIITVLSVISTFICIKYGLAADFPMTLISIAVVFPIVFSISGAYSRREKALSEYGVIKSHGRALYFAARDWLEDSDAATREKLKELLGEFLKSSRKLFTESKESMRKNEEEVYRDFSDLSKFIKGFRGKGLASGEVSRCNQFLSKMMIAFENVKHIYQYRTPRTLRAYCDVFIVVLPIIYGPYFAHLASEYAGGLAYIMPILFSVVLVSLDNIQDHLENPFDQIGEDDVIINAELFMERLDL